jgi:hypothetical protein
MADMTAPATLEELRDEQAGRAFPRALLRRCNTALVLFAAGFYGRQDAFWVADAGLRATCVDNDQAFLGRMQKVYPNTWEFTQADAFFYATYTDRRWDLVTVDCPSNLFDRCASEMETWCRIADTAVVLGTGKDTVVETPPGWRFVGRRHRSDFVGGVYWTILEHT